MKITEIHIDGFGMFHNRHFSELDGNLVVFQGNNEAGKSTLLGFIRTILFGFPRANAKNEILYPPVAGGVHGGRLGITMTGGEHYLVSRGPGKHGGRVSIDGPEGQKGDAGLLNRLLGGVGYEVFRNVFAFGLSELQSMETLQGEALKSAVYGAGLGTGIMALPRAKKRIQNRLDGLFKSGGTKPLINSKLAELEKIAQQLNDAGSQSGRYDAALEIRRQLDRRVSALGRQRKHHQAQRERLRAYRLLWPEWLAFLENEAALSAVRPVVTTFPEDGILRFEREWAACRKNEADLAALSRDQRRLTEKIAALDVDTDLLSQAAAIGKLVEEKNAYQEKCRRCPELIQEKNALNAGIKNRLNTLGPRVSEEDLFAMDRSVFIRDDIRKFQSRYLAAHAALAGNREISADRKNRLTQATHALFSAENALDALGEPAPEPDHPAVLTLKQGRDRFAESIQTLATLTVRHARSRKDLARSLKEIDPAWGEAHLERFDTQASARRRVAEFSDKMAVLREACRGAVAMDHDKALVHAQARRQLTAAEKMLPPPQTARQWGALLLGLTAGGAGAWWGWGLSEPCLPATGFCLAVSMYLVCLLKRIIKRRVARLKQRDEIDRLERIFSDSQSAVAEARGALRRAGETLAAFSAEWQRYLQSMGFSTDLLPAVMMTLFSKVESARGLMRECRELEERILRAKQIQAAYADTAGKVVPAVSAGVKETPETLLQAVDRYIAVLPAQDRHRETVHRAREAVRLKTEEKKAARRALDESLARRETLTHKAAEIDAAWRAWLTAHGLPDAFSPEAALDALDILDAVVSDIAVRERTAGDIARLTADIDAYRAEIRAVLSFLKWPVAVDNERWPQPVDALRSALAESRGNQREIDALKEQLALNRNRITAARQQLDASRNAMGALLAEAGVDSEESFRQYGRVYAERRGLLAAIVLNEKNMRRITGTFDLEALTADLKRLTLGEITTREKEEELLADKIAQELEEVRNRRAAVNQEIVSLSSDDEIAVLRSEAARLQAELQSLAFDWSRYALADYLIDKARAAFEREHQPHVIQDAGAFFKKFTGHRYTELIAPLGENTLQAMGADHRWVRPETLSRGTAEQLYLAIRFGFIRHRAGNNEPLPVVMDDILVNFDPDRATAAVEAIAALAQSHQVLFFTCHPETVARFEHTGGRVRVVTLDGG